MSAALREAMDTRNNKIAVVAGPTASGKTRLGIALAREFDGEIVSADSMQLYRGMDVALKVVGVGSVGTRALIVVMEGANREDSGGGLCEDVVDGYVPQHLSAYPAAGA